MRDENEHEHEQPVTMQGLVVWIPISIGVISFILGIVTPIVTNVISNSARVSRLEATVDNLILRLNEEKAEVQRLQEHVEQLWRDTSPRSVPPIN